MRSAITFGRDSRHSVRKLFMLAAVVALVPLNAACQDMPKAFPNDADTQVLLRVVGGRLQDASGLGLEIKRKGPDAKKSEHENFIRFNGKDPITVSNHDKFNVGADFAIEVHLRLPETPEKDYSCIITCAKTSPRGGFALAVRRNGTLSLWASRKTWLQTNLVVTPGLWHTVGAMSKNNRLFIFCDDEMFGPINFDDTPIIPTKSGIVIGGIKCDIMDIRISGTPRRWDEVTPGGKGDWELPQAYLRDNAFRGEVVLNGFWGIRNVGQSEYIKVRVPDQQKTKDTREFYREFTLPQSWQGRRLVLEVDRLSADGIVLVDGKELARIRKGKRFIPVALPAKATGAGPYRVMIRTGTIYGDVWLRSYPASATYIDDTYMMTSYRRMEAAVRLAGRSRRGGRVTPVVRIYQEPGEKGLVKTIRPSKPVEAGQDGRWQVELTAPWKKPKLWTRWHPNLYYYTVELLDEKGETVDKILPRRFGFREVWVENGQFVLNGNPVTICDEVWEGTVGYKNGMREQIEFMLKNLKSMGLTGGFRVSNDTVFNVADEVGMLFASSAGSMVKLNIWDPKSGLTAMTGDEDVEDIKRLARRWREHPSIITWDSNTAYSLTSMHPSYAGQYYDPWFYFPANRNINRAHEAQLIFKKAVDLLAEVDPTRVVAAGTSPFSPVERITRYLCYNLDLQEREELFDHWFRSGRPKAIWVAEFGAPFQAHYFIRRIDHQMPHTGLWPKIYLEVAAGLFGEQAYLQEPDSLISRWGNMRYNETMGTPVMQKCIAEQAYNIWRSWRTYGVNLSAHHIITAHAFEPAGTLQERWKKAGLADASDPRRPGLSQVVHRGGFPVLGLDEILPAGEAILRGTKTLLAYIGGPDTNFNNKDHLYFAGAKVRKALIVLNDWDEDADISGQWRLLDAAGKAVKTGKLKGAVKTGGRAMTDFPIEFDAPEVTKRSDFTLQVKVRSNLPGSLDDSFAITVFPAHKAEPVKFSGTIWRLNISDDATHETQHFLINRDNQEFLAAAGVKSRLIKGLKTFEYMGYSPAAALDLYKGRKTVTEGVPKPGDMLIIPRHTLREFRDDRQLAIRLLERMNLDKLIEQGLRVIVFEQDLPNIFGIQTEDVRPRRVFMAAKGHRVFKGLQESDLSYWSGQSDLTHAITPLSATEIEFPDRMWHTSNTNSVATRTLIRPQVGSSRALAVSGFDLAQSPLLEVTRGKGRILFCMMDVANRYGKDPAATIIVDNILRYMATAPQPDGGKAKVAFLKADGKTVVNKKHLFRAAKPTGQDGWGITQAELFFRESIYENNWITRKLPDVSVGVLAGSQDADLPSVIRRNVKTGLFEMTLDESMFETGWARRKVVWIRNSLIVNQGGSLSEGPGIGHHGRSTVLYPHVWVENFVHPYTADIW